MTPSVRAHGKIISATSMKILEILSSAQKSSAVSTPDMETALEQKPLVLDVPATSSSSHSLTSPRLRTSVIVKVERKNAEEKASPSKVDVKPQHTNAFLFNPVVQSQAPSVNRSKRKRGLSGICEFLKNKATAQQQDVQAPPCMKKIKLEEPFLEEVFREIPGKPCTTVVKMEEPEEEPTLDVAFEQPSLPSELADKEIKFEEGAPPLAKKKKKSGRGPETAFTAAKPSKTKKPLRCPAPGCSQAFDSKAGMIQHETKMHLREGRCLMSKEDATKYNFHPHVNFDVKRYDDLRNRLTTCHIDGCGQRMCITVGKSGHVNWTHKINHLFQCTLCKKEILTRQGMLRHLVLDGCKGDYRVVELVS